MQWLKARLAEPSTHAGLASILVVIAGIVPEYQNYILGAAVMLGGVAVVKKD